MPDFPSDQTTQLVALAQGGDRRALEGLFIRYLPRVRQIVALRMGYRATDLYAMEDLVQDALLRVFKGLDTFEIESEHRFRYWLVRCVMNSVRENLRHAKARKRGGTLTIYPLSSEAEILSAFASECTPDQLAEASELAEMLEDAILQLPSKEREVIVLSRLCGYPSSEIASLLGDSAANIRQILSRSLLKLKQRFG